MALRNLPRHTAVLLVVFASCLTVNVYFYPSEKVDETAKEIIEDIRGTGATEMKEGTPTEGTAPEEQSRSGWLLASARAAEKETTVSNPEIVRLKDAVKGRAPLLLPSFKSGAIGESNDGLVVVRDPSAVPMKDRARLNTLVKEENQDREALYAKVAEALGVKDKDFPKVRKSFAKEWQETAGSGWWVQQEDGNWIKLP